MLGKYIDSKTSTAPAVFHVTMSIDPNIDSVLVTVGSPHVQSIHDHFPLKVLSAEMCRDHRHPEVELTLLGGPPPTLP